MKGSVFGDEPQSAVRGGHSTVVVCHFAVLYRVTRQVDYYSFC